MLRLKFKVFSLSLREAGIEIIMETQEVSLTPLQRNEELREQSKTGPLSEGRVYSPEGAGSSAACLCQE